ncbi:cupin domain-containing protein [Sorangium sp. So ce291]|uniref:cupin domain-containing protein n=1 Tax=Sorangium sp. So ce291 TaxID=3133294 RepID=UPI003F5D8F72
MKKIDLAQAPVRVGTAYPPPYDAQCRERKRLRLGIAAGLKQLGVNQLRLAPGQWSSQRHWHSASEEFVMVLEGEVVLVTDAGEEVLRAGDCAGFRAGDPDGHHLQNRSDREAVVLEVGTNPPNDVGEYPDIDLRALPDGYVRKDGTPYGPR